MFVLFCKNTQISALHNLPIDDIPNSMMVHVSLVEGKILNVQVRLKKPSSKMISTRNGSSETHGPEIIADANIDVSQKDAAASPLLM